MSAGIKIGADGFIVVIKAVEASNPHHRGNNQHRRDVQVTGFNGEQGRGVLRLVGNIAASREQDPGDGSGTRHRDFAEKTVD